MQLVNKNTKGQSLLAALSALADSLSEDECAAALLRSAQIIQEAVLSNVEDMEFAQTLATIPAKLQPAFSATLSRAVDFNLNEELKGGSLGFWLLPITIGTDDDATLPATLKLDNRGLVPLRASAKLKKQLDALMPANEVSGYSWSHVVPTLYSAKSLSGADMGELVSLPVQVRQMIQGVRDIVNFHPADVGPSEAIHGVHLYFLPVIAFHPTANLVGAPAESTETARLVAGWVEGALGRHAKSPSVRVAGRPHPFSVALDMGERMAFAERARQKIDQVCVTRGVQAAGMAALVAPYQVNDTEVVRLIGVSLVSRLTKCVLAFVSLATFTDDGAEELALVTQVLHEMGMTNVQERLDPVMTAPCQHCGRLQYALPSVEAVNEGMLNDASGMQ